MSSHPIQVFRKQKPTSELGVTGLNIQYQTIYEQPVRALQGSRGKAIWKEMSRYDPIIGAALTASEMLCRSAIWRVEPASDSNEDEQAAEYLEQVQQDMSHSWQDFIADALTMLAFGFSYFEIVLKQRRGEQRQPGLSSKYNDGLYGIRKLAGRGQDSIDRWEIDESGGIQAAIQNAPPDYRDIELPIERCLLFRTTIRKNNPEGRSVLENAYVPWFAKKRIQEYEWIRVERDATGIPVIKCPAELLRTDASTEDAALLTTLKKIVRDVKFNEQAGIVFPLVYDEQGNELYKFELVSAPGARPADSGLIIERLDKQMAMSLLADVILLGHEKVGSYALASSKTTLFSVALGAYLDEIADVLNRHLVPRLFRWNGKTVEEYPKWVHGDIETIDLKELAEYITALANAGAPLFPDEELEAHLREVAGLPKPLERDDDVDMPDELKPLDERPQPPMPFGTQAQPEGPGANAPEAGTVRQPGE